MRCDRHNEIVVCYFCGRADSLSCDNKPDRITKLAEQVDHLMTVIDLTDEERQTLRQGPSAIEKLILQQREMHQQLASNDELIYAPGEWKCEQCGFNLIKKELYVQTGQIGMDREEDLEGCPNDGCWMKRVTWKEIAINLGKQLESLVLERL